MARTGNHGTDVAVVGAGIIGAAIAWRLARTGLAVTLIEADRPAGGASGACDGYLSVSTKLPGPAQTLAAWSQRLWPAWAKALASPIDYHRPGGLLLAETAADLPALDAHRRTLATIGVELMLIDGPAARRLAPALAPSLAGALDCPEEAQVNPYLATLALVEAGREAGVRTLFGRRPAAIAAVGDTNPRLELVGDGASTITLNAGRVVLAAGVGTPALAALVGVELPIRPRRGELVVTAGPGIACDRVLVSGRYLAAKAGSGAAPLGHGFVMERLATGQSLIGGTRVFAGDDRRATAEGVALILREAILRVPAVAAATVLRAFAGLRPATPDGRALIGALPDQPRLLVAAGHEGDGITAAPATAEILCHLLAGGAPPPIDLAPFAPTRFTPPSAGAGPGAAGTG